MQLGACDAAVHHICDNCTCDFICERVPLVMQLVSVALVCLYSIVCGQLAETTIAETIQTNGDEWSGRMAVGSIAISDSSSNSRNRSMANGHPAAQVHLHKWQAMGDWPVRHHSFLLAVINCCWPANCLAIVYAIAD